MTAVSKHCLSWQLCLILVHAERSRVRRHKRVTIHARKRLRTHCITDAYVSKLGLVGGPLCKTLHPALPDVSDHTGM